MSCHVMSCHVMSWHGMAWHGMACHVMSCHVMHACMYESWRTSCTFTSSGPYWLGGVAGLPPRAGSAGSTVIMDGASTSEAMAKIQQQGLESSLREGELYRVPVQRYVAHVFQGSNACQCSNSDTVVEPVNATTSWRITIDENWLASVLQDARVRNLGWVQ